MSRRSALKTLRSDGGQASPHLGEFFYLDKDELDESDSGTRLPGGNYEFSHGENTTIGVTSMKLFAHEEIEPGRDGLKRSQASTSSPTPTSSRIRFAPMSNPPTRSAAACRSSTSASIGRRRSRLP